MASRVISGCLLCAVALVFLVLLQGTQSVYIQVCAGKVLTKQRLGWRGMLGKSLRTVQDPGLSPAPNHTTGQKSRWVEAAGTAGGSDGSNDNNKVWVILRCLPRVPIPSEARWGVRHSACP